MSTEIISIFLWITPEKSSKHCHFTCQIAFSQNTICSEHSLSFCTATQGEHPVEFGMTPQEVAPKVRKGFHTSLCASGWKSRRAWGNFADSHRVKISWIPGKYILFIINNFTETLCGVDDWIFHFLGLSSISVYYLCQFLTFCTVEKMCVGGYVTVIFHILSIRKHCF